MRFSNNYWLRFKFNILILINMDSAESRRFFCNQITDIGDNSIKALSGIGWRQSTLSAFPSRVLYCFKPSRQASGFPMSRSIQWLQASTLLGGHLWIKISPLLHCRVCISIRTLTEVILLSLKSHLGPLSRWMPILNSRLASIFKAELMLSTWAIWVFVVGRTRPRQPQTT